MDDNTDRTQNGFELHGEFYRWNFSDIGKDLMLIDRISGMAPSDFYEAVDDPSQRERSPILLTLIATSIRHLHHDWSVERIYRTVLELSLSEDVKFINGESEEETRPLPDETETPPEAEPPPPPEPETQPAEQERSPSNVSLLPSTPPASSISETSSASLR